MRTSRTRQALAALLALVAVLGCTARTGPAEELQGSRFAEGATGETGVVATESPPATRIALDVLARGGNAVDAAVAAVFAVSVARPQSCGLGGGGFLVHRAADGETTALDFRETAPAAFAPDSLQGPGLHRRMVGHLVVGVPGTVAGLTAALERLGTLSLAEALAPAERLAREGVEVRPPVAAAIRRDAATFRLFPAAAEQFLGDDGEPPDAGDLLVQPVLADTLAAIAEGGPEAFYRGPIAERIVASMESAEERAGDRGLMTLEDLAGYEAIWREPIIGTYRGHEVIGMPPPSSGGIAVQEMLNLLEGFDLGEVAPGSADHLHLLAEAQKIAFADRAIYLADPDAVDIPVEGLLSDGYAQDRRADVDPERAGVHTAGIFEDAPAAPPGAEGNPDASTTHISVIDAEGDAAALTCTVESSFGSGVVAPGTGFVLNNELTDFSPPGTANEPGPGKRPRSSMAPTIVVGADVPVLVHGGAGGARIIMGALQPIVAVVDHGMSLAQALDMPRVEAAVGGGLQVEGARLAAETLDELRARGHAVSDQGEYASLPRVQAAGVDPATGTRTAVADPRTDGAAAAQP